MAAERGHNRDRPPLEELSPELRGAVERVLSDPVPDDFTRRALEGARGRVPRARQKFARRNLVWVLLGTAASIGAIVLVLWLRGGRAREEQAVKVPASRAAARDVPAAAAGYLPTAWAYDRAARQSPEALDALLDRHARQALAADPQSLRAGASFRSLRQML